MINLKGNCTLEIDNLHDTNITLDGLILMDPPVGKLSSNVSFVNGIGFVIRNQNK